MKIETDLLTGQIVISADGQDGELVILKNGAGLRVTEKNGRLTQETGRVLGTIFQTKTKTAKR